MAKTPEQSVREFHVKYGHLITDQATTEIPAAVVGLRVRLINEEHTELMEAIEKDDLIEIADGIADLVYVLVGTAISYGIPFDRIFAEVHNSNMTKTAIKSDGTTKYGTKIPKGPDFLAPQIQKILYFPELPTILEKNDSTTVS
jgi:hypothetical protein